MIGYRFMLYELLLSYGPKSLSTAGPDFVSVSTLMMTLREYH